MTYSEWLCDACRQPIDNPSQGWIEWFSSKDMPPPKREHRSFALRLVHADEGCQYPPPPGNVSLGDGHVTDYLGPRGLINFLIFLADKQFNDDTEVLRMMKRLHPPGTEKTFRNFNQVIDEETLTALIGDVDLQDELAAVLMRLRGAYDVPTVPPGADADTTPVPNSGLLLVRLCWIREHGGDCAINSHHLHRVRQFINRRGVDKVVEAVRTTRAMGFDNYEKRFQHFCSLCLTPASQHHSQANIGYAAAT